MAAPKPPQGNQQQHTERPARIFGEQYVSGQPRVALPAGWVVVHATDWVITNRYTGAAVEVLSAEEFAERFGPGGAP